MSVKIRLRRVGRKKQPYYRVVVTDTAAPRDGQYLDTVGFYNPLTRPAELRMDLDKVDKWVADGAGMSDTVTSLVRKARSGGDDKVSLKQPGEATAKVRPAPAKEVAGKAAPAAPPAAAAEEPAAKVENAPEAAGSVPPQDEAAQAAEPEAVAEPEPKAEEAEKAEPKAEKPEPEAEKAEPEAEKAEPEAK